MVVTGLTFIMMYINSPMLFQTDLAVMAEQPWLCCSPGGLVNVRGATAVVEISAHIGARRPSLWTMNQESHT